MYQREGLRMLLIDEENNIAHIVGTSWEETVNDYFEILEEKNSGLK